MILYWYNKRERERERDLALVFDNNFFLNEGKRQRTQQPPKLEAPTTTRERERKSFIRYKDYSTVVVVVVLLLLLLGIPRQNGIMYNGGTTTTTTVTTVNGTHPSNRIKHSSYASFQNSTI